MGAEYFSKRGWFERGELRVRPSDTSYLYFNYQGMVDRGIGSPPQNQGGEDALFRAERPFGTFRGVANIDYLSSFIFRIAFTDVYSQAVDSEVRSQIFSPTPPTDFTSMPWRNATRTSISAARAPSRPCARLHHPDGAGPDFAHAQRIHLRRGAATGQHAPVLVVRERRRRLAASRNSRRIAVAAGLRNADLVGRFDLAPTLSMPLQWQGWSFRPALILRDTFYTEEFNATFANATGKAADDILNRKSLEASIELRPPSLSRVFDHPWLGRKWKHVIEPRIRYDYVTGVNNFADILRFDAADVLTNTNEVEYSIVNRIYSRHMDPNVKTATRRT